MSQVPYKTDLYNKDYTGGATITTPANTAQPEQWAGWGAVTQVFSLANTLFSDPSQNTTQVVTAKGTPNNPGIGVNNAETKSTITYAIYAGVALVVLFILYSVVKK